MTECAPVQVLSTVNKLLAKGHLQLLQNAEGDIIYKYKEKVPVASGSGGVGKGTGVSLSKEEQLVLQIIAEAGTSSIWNRDIRTKSNLSIIQVNKVIKVLEAQSLIKEVKGASGRKKMYILYDLELDLNQCRSPWVNLEGEAEVEFIRIVLDQCERCLQERSDQAKEKYPDDSITRHHACFVSIAEIASLIKGLNVSKVDLKPQDIEALMDLLVYDSKAEKNVKGSTELEHSTSYKLIPSLLPPSGLVCTPCGICPVKKDCSPIGDITPVTCEYFNDYWLPNQTGF
ncbi:DNA-directed RNA polymerase III subunit RPC6-like isoform X2 [Symsagittifera roscoffensis]